MFANNLSPLLMQPSGFYSPKVRAIPGSFGDIFQFPVGSTYEKQMGWLASL